MSKRTEKVADLIRRELAGILTTKMRDPRVGWVSVTGVDVTPDLSVAKIWLSALGGSERRDEVLGALRHAAPFLRRELAPRLGLREMPELRFAYDESIEHGARVEELLRKIHDGTPIDDEDEDEDKEGGGSDAAGGPEKGGRPR
ncbi:MAG: 30S ribosome-binding factor RbfA [Candidatus Eiseniibacteriota bacterium]